MLLLRLCHQFLNTSDHLVLLINSNGPHKPVNLLRKGLHLSLLLLCTLLHLFHMNIFPVHQTTLTIGQMNVPLIHQRGFALVSCCGGFGFLLLGFVDGVGFGLGLAVEEGGVHWVGRVVCRVG